MLKTKITIRGIDPELYQRARIQALRDHLAIGDWINKKLKKILGE